MSFTPPQSGSNTPRPFRIVLEQVEEAQTDHFRPTAVLQITPALRTSGFLRGLPAEEVKTLLIVLTYVTPNGVFLATVPQMAEAMRVTEGKMEQRLRRLQGFAWQGEPLLREQVRESGLRSYAPSVFLVEIEQRAFVPTRAVGTPVLPASNREEVIAHSRATYTHPRAEVERQIAEQNGWDIPGTGATDTQPSTLYRRLLRFGILPEQAEELLAQHPAEEIQQQLDWLPYRKARKPGPLLIAAIENGYAEPIATRQRRLFDQAIHTPRGAEDPSQEVDSLSYAVPLVEGEPLVLPSIPTENSDPTNA
ncbi:MAG: hypothetical protein JWN14_2628 [Chthonomonadales bacterium]|nr:hypothetical protein [Chthonomonadales bacterium]